MQYEVKKVFLVVPKTGSSQDIHNYKSIHDNKKEAEFVAKYLSDADANDPEIPQDHQQR